MFCPFPSQHHSDDTVTIFHGAVEPVRACGFHATHFTAETVSAANKKEN